MEVEAVIEEMQSNALFIGSILNLIEAAEDSSIGIDDYIAAIKECDSKIKNIFFQIRRY